MSGFLSPWRGLPLLLIPEYSGINKEQRIPDRSKTAHQKPPVKCFLTVRNSDWASGSAAPQAFTEAHLHSQATSQVSCQEKLCKMHVECDLR